MADEFDEFDDDDDGVDDTPLIKKLRAENRRLAKEAKDRAEREAKLAERERSLAFRDAGLTLEGRKLKAFEAAHEGDWTAEAVKATAVELGWLEGEDAEIDADLDTHAAMAAARAGAQSAGSARITPATYSEWPAEKRRAFVTQHPNHANALKRGEEVVGVTF